MLTVMKEMGISAKKKTNGAVGLEIEVEGTNLPFMNNYWRNEVDGSLRGNESREYVLVKPLSLVNLGAALNELEKAYIANETIVDDTVRAGVHVHINCQDLTMVELYTLFTVYLIVEELLLRYCGQYRQGNLFCLRAKDAEYLVSVIRRAAHNKKFKLEFHTDDLRYASMNVKALGDYGSLEFRSMRGTRDLGTIYLWAELLHGLKEASRGYRNPCSVIEDFSINGPEAFLRKIFTTHTDKVIGDSKDIDEAMYNGARVAQDIAFCANWELWNAEDIMIGGLSFPPEMAAADEPMEDY